MPELIPATRHQSPRMAGYWVFWKRRRWNHLKREEETRIHCGMVQRKQKETLHTYQHDRVPVILAWLLDGSIDVDKHWPKYEWGSFQGLTPDEAKVIFQTLDITVPEVTE